MRLTGPRRWAVPPHEKGTRNIDGLRAEYIDFAQPQWTLRIRLACCWQPTSGSFWSPGVVDSPLEKIFAITTCLGR